MGFLIDMLYCLLLDISDYYSTASGLFNKEVEAVSSEETYWPPCLPIIKFLY
jgi:hypothetical protein